MTSNNVAEVPIGMQRLSCMPCRKRKSKCDRSQPCSSCVLRSTERFCYTSTAEEGSSATTASSASGDSAPTTNAKKRDERIPKGSTSATSPSESSPSGRPTKMRKSTNDSREDLSAMARKRNGMNAQARKNSGDVAATAHDADADIDRSAILSAINSIKATLSSLEAKLGQTTEGHLVDDNVSPTIEWKDIDPWLPSRADCRSILDCFASDCNWLFAFINMPMFYKTFDKFAEGEAVSRPFAALVLFLIGVGLNLAPPSHPAHQLSCRADNKLFMEHGSQVLWPNISPFVYVPESTERVQAQLLLCYYQALNGWADAGDAQLGKLLRIARAIHLFDEDKWNTTGMSDWDLELRRLLACEIAQLDRFVSMHFLRPTVLPQAINVTTPTYLAFDSYDVKTGMRLGTEYRPMEAAKYHLGKTAISQGAFASGEFLLNFLRRPAVSRYQAARDLDARLEHIETQAIDGELQYSSACNLSVLTTPALIRNACQSLVLCTSIRRQRCTVMRQFLLDREAPVDLRMAALEHAKFIIETAPVVIALSSSPWLGFSPSWCSGHLFCAASTFAIVYLGEEDQQNMAPELDWFASKIFEVLDTLSVLGMRDRVAKRAEELLIALCTSRDTLRAKLVASKRGARHDAAKAEGIAASSQSSMITVTADAPSIVQAWPGFRNVLPAVPAGANGNSHIPPSLANIADAPALRQSPSSLYNQQSVRISPSTSFVLPDAAASQRPTSSHVAFSSPESFTAGGSGSTPDTQNGTALASALDDAQWTALISSLDGDMASLVNTTVMANGNNDVGSDLAFPFAPLYQPSGMPTTPAIPL